MVAQRILCLRLANWPIQVLRRRLHQQTGNVPPVALHTAVRESALPVPGRTATHPSDLQFLREIFPAARSGPAIVAVCQSAFARGVRPGLPLAEARSLAAPVSRPQRAGRSGKPPNSPAMALQDVHFSEWDGGQDRQELTDLCELVRRFAPVVGIDEMPLPDSLLLDITGCAPLFGSEAALARELLDEVRNAGLNGVAAIADTIAAAWAIAHWEVPKPAASSARSRGVPTATSGSGMTGQPEFPRVRISPAGLNPIDLEQLPITAVRLPITDCDILQQLGIHTVRQLQRLPLIDLPARLSPTGVLRIQQLRSVRPEQILPVPEPSPVYSAWSGEAPAQGLRDLHWILRQLTAEIARQLGVRRRLCSSLECDFSCVEGPELRIRTGLVRPEATAELLADVITLRLDYLVTRAMLRQQRRSGEQTTEESEFDYALLEHQPIHRITLTAGHVPIPPSRQRDLFGSDEHVAWTDELSTLLSRLTGRLSEENVRYFAEQADARPEHSLRAHRFPDASQPGASQATERLLDALTGLAETRSTSTSGSPVRAGKPRANRSRAGTSEPPSTPASAIDDQPPAWARTVSGPQDTGIADTGGTAGTSAPQPESHAGPPRPVRMFAKPIDITATFPRNNRGGDSLTRHQSAPPATQQNSPPPAQQAVTPELALKGRLTTTTPLPATPFVLRLPDFTWTIERISRPERIQTAWWTDAPCHRDYFQMTATNGARLWLFRDLQTDRWYLHGIFD